MYRTEAEQQRVRPGQPDNEPAHLLILVDRSEPQLYERRDCAASSL